MGPRVFQSKAMLDIVSVVAKVASTTVPVLLIGETGVGKEVVADLIHEKSSRGHRAFVKINCAALPKELIESELFGHAVGAFTGAKHVAGLLNAAHGSTILLDELSEMPLDLQTRLLRVMQDHMVRSVGMVTSKQVDIRVIACLNQDPEELILERRLRDDLYYRLATVVIRIPPLRERAEDIVPLANAYVDYYAKGLRREIRLARSAIRAIEGHHWPGNVRELALVMHRAMVLNPQAIELEQAHLDLKIMKPLTSAPSIPLNSEMSIQGVVKEAAAIITSAILKVVVENVTRAVSGTQGPITPAPALSAPAATKRHKRPYMTIRSSEDMEKYRVEMLDALRKSNGRPGAAAKLLGIEYDLFYRRRARLKIKDEWKASPALNEGLMK